MKRIIFPAFCLITAVYFWRESSQLSAEVERLKAPAPVDTAINAQEAKIAAYLRSVGGLYPELIAQVCIDTTMPEMCAAVAMVESTANPYTLPGDAGESRGAWQIQEKHWRHFVGPVSHDPAVQAQQWSAVMEFLLRSKSLPGAIWSYNGGSSRYVAKVYGHYLEMK